MMSTTRATRVLVTSALLALCASQSAYATQGGAQTPRGAAKPRAAVSAPVTGHYTLPSGRTFWLHYDPANLTSPKPLVVAFHGAAHTASQMQTQTDLTAFSNSRDFVLVYGDSAVVNGADSGTWNAGVCCGSALSTNVDDVGYFRDVVTMARTLTPIDPARVYAWGWSNGGGMAYRVACEAPDVVAGVGVVSGWLGVPCASTTVRVMHIHGMADTTVPFHGGAGYQGVVFPNASNESSTPWAPFTTAAGSVVVQWPTQTGGHQWDLIVPGSPQNTDDTLWRRMVVWTK